MAGAAEQAGEFINVSDAEALENIFRLSHDRAVVLFKHSTTCPISAAAYREMSQVSKGGVALLVIQRARELSREVERLTGVRHESPQAIVLRNGQSVWAASHFAVTSDAVERALEDNQ